QRRRRESRAGGGSRLLRRSCPTAPAERAIAVSNPDDNGGGEKIESTGRHRRHRRDVMGGVERTEDIPQKNNAESGRENACANPAEQSGDEHGGIVKDRGHDLLGELQKDNVSDRGENGAAGRKQVGRSRAGRQPLAS